MSDLSLQLDLYLALIKTNIPVTLTLISGLWVIHFVNVILGHRLSILGVYPRHGLGLIGIPFFSFLHADFNHLFFNSIPLFILMNLILINGVPQFLCVTETIILLSGVALWLFGRPAIHIGASCLIMGYWSYLLSNAYHHPSGTTLILGIVCVYYLGSLVASLFPLEEQSSWEGHIFGFLAGLVANYPCGF